MLMVCERGWRRDVALWLAACGSILVGGQPESVLYAGYARSLLARSSGHFSRLMLLSIRERCFLSAGAAERAPA
jgi:hypothetical protein